MIFTQHMRRKRCKRRLSTRAQPDDEVDDPSFPEFVWAPLFVLSLILLAVGAVVGIVGSPLGDIVKTLYALVCLTLFALTTMHLINAARNNIESGHLNSHFYRKQTLKQVIRETFLTWIVGSMLYVPSIVIPAYVFRAGWLGYTMLLVEVTILAFDTYVVIRWRRHHIFPDNIPRG